MPPTEDPGVARRALSRSAAILVVGATSRAGPGCRATSPRCGAIQPSSLSDPHPGIERLKGLRDQAMTSPSFLPTGSCLTAQALNSCLRLVFQPDAKRLFC